MVHNIELFAGTRLLSTLSFTGYQSFLHAQDIEWSDVDAQGKVTIKVRVTGAEGADRVSVGYIRLKFPQRLNLHGAVDWLAARADIDRARIVVLGWSHGGSTLLAALQHRIGPMPLQARAAVAFSPDCSLYGRTQGSYLPVAPLLILLDAPEERRLAAPCLELAKWTPKVMVRVLPERDHNAALLEFLERELR